MHEVSACSIAVCERPPPYFPTILVVPSFVRTYYTFPLNVKFEINISLTLVGSIGG
jgi:hypothetical protein